MYGVDGLRVDGLVRELDTYSAVQWCALSANLLVAVVFGEEHCPSAEDVEWSILVGLDVLVPLHLHLKTNILLRLPHKPMFFSVYRRRHHRDFSQ